MSGAGSDNGNDAGNNSGRRAANTGPRTIETDADVLETAAAAERAREEQARKAGAAPETLDAAKVAPVADTVFADDPDDVAAWPERPGVLARLVRSLTALAVGLVVTGVLGALASAALTRFIDGDGVWAGAALAGAGLLIVVLVAMVARDLVALSRLGSVTRLRRQAQAAKHGDTRALAEGVCGSVIDLYRRRPDMEWPIAAFRDDRVSIAGAAALVDALDDRVLAPLDRRARRVVAETARRAAVITAVSPFAALDMMATVALTARAASRIAAIYGVRPGRLGTVTLVRRAFFTVIAAGAIDAADDLIGDLVGSGLATQLSRRAGVGVLNGLLVARLTLAIADEVRPLPWRPGRRPSARMVVREVLTGSRTGGGQTEKT